MRIAHLSTSDISGGAARSAFRLHKSLAGVGVDSVMFVANRASESEDVIQFIPSRHPWQRMLRGWRRWQNKRTLDAYEPRPKGFEWFDSDRSRFGKEPLRTMPQRDLVNLHWVSNFVDYPSNLPQLAAESPVVWTMHDMNLVTGGCHYDHGCNHYLTGCGMCPQLGSKQEGDLSREVWKRKEWVLNQIPRHRLHVVAPSQWMARVAAQSPWLGRFGISVIPYGLKTTTFAPNEREVTRQRWGIAPDVKVILFVADSMEIHRKGHHLLVEALNGLPETANILQVSVGEVGAARQKGPRQLCLGRIKDDSELAAIYSAADIFVIPSLEDNLPNTVMESLACGTPVVGFSVGGITDMVRSGETGTLVAPRDVRALREAVRDLLENDAKRHEMSRVCRQTAVREYGEELQARRYRDLYEQLVRDSGGIRTTSLAGRSN